MFTAKLLRETTFGLLLKKKKKKKNPDLQKLAKKAKNILQVS